MSTSVKVVIVASVAASLLAWSPARAAPLGSAAPDVAAARIAWADRHVELVCGALWDAGQRRRAEMCVADARRVIQDARRGADATGSLAAASIAPAAVAIPVAPAAVRAAPVFIAPVSMAVETVEAAPRSGLKLLRSFSSLGIGF